MADGLSAINCVCHEDFIFYLKKFKCVKKKLKQSGQIDEFNYYFGQFMDEYNEKYFGPMLLVDLTSENIDYYNVIKEGYLYIKQHFKKMYKKYVDIYECIVDRLSCYYVGLCEDKIIYIDGLIDNIYILEELCGIVIGITNYTNDEDDIIKLFEKLYNMYKEYSLRHTLILAEFKDSMWMISDVCKVNPEIYPLFEKLNGQYNEYVSQHSIILNKFDMITKIVKNKSLKDNYSVHFSLLSSAIQNSALNLDSIIM
jgi:hypothetical protein